MPTSTCRQWNHAIDDGREIRTGEAVDLLLAEGADARLKNQQGDSTCSLQRRAPGRP
jgi:hypothetical protein